MKKIYSGALLLVLLSFPAFSQECDPMVDPFCEDVDLPLDSGVGVLLAIGTFYGIRKNKKASQTEDITSI